MNYPATMMGEAKRLRKAGWSLSAIAEMQGVSKNTVLRWTDPKQAAKQAVRVRAAHRRAWNERLTGRMPAAGNLSPDFRLIRAGALRRIGLSIEDISRVMSFDFPAHPVTRSQVERALGTGRWPKSPSVRRREAEAFQAAVLAPSCPLTEEAA